MRDRLRVIVGGPGSLGGVAIWEVVRLESLDLVGVRSFSSDKVGRDVH
jgi:hypothetical protein